MLLLFIIANFRLWECIFEFKKEKCCLLVLRRNKISNMKVMLGNTKRVEAGKTALVTWLNSTF